MSNSDVVNRCSTLNADRLPYGKSTSTLPYGKSTNIRDVKLGKKLGDGKFGIVYKAKGYLQKTGPKSKKSKSL